MKNIILCADDYGQNSSISQAIIALIKGSRLSATSCMTTSPEWPKHGHELEPFQNQVDVGLHFNLTEGIPLSSEFTQTYGREFPSVSKLLIKSHLGMLNTFIIESEFNAQLDHFVSVMNCLPRFIDGHQHVHQFPTIRNAIMRVYEKRLRPVKVYLRSVKTPIRFTQIKDTIIQLSGADALQRLLIKKHIPHNSSFSGIYDFTHSNQYADLFPKILSEIKQAGLIMCHPGLQSSTGAQDTIAKSRFDEYQYFMSDAFVRDCKKAGVELRRFNFL